MHMTSRRRSPARAGTPGASCSGCCSPTPRFEIGALDRRAPGRHQLGDHSTRTCARSPTGSARADRRRPTLAGPRRGLARPAARRVGRARRRSCRDDVVVVDCGADHRLTDAGGLGRVLRRRRTPAPGPTGCPSCPAGGAARALAGATRIAVPGCYADRRARLALAPGCRRRAGRAGRRRRRRRVRHLRRRPVAQAAPARQRGDGLDCRRTGVGGVHRHTPEIEQNLARRPAPTSRSRSPRCWCRCPAASSPPAPRGSPPATDAEAVCAPRCDAAYADEPFVHLLPEGAVAAHRRRRSAPTPSTCRSRSTSAPAGWSSSRAIDNLARAPPAGHPVRQPRPRLPETTGLPR